MSSVQCVPVCSVLSVPRIPQHQTCVRNPTLMTTHSQTFLTRQCPDLCCTQSSPSVHVCPFCPGYPPLDSEPRPTSWGAVHFPPEPCVQIQPFSHAWCSRKRKRRLFPLPQNAPSQQQPTHQNNQNGSNTLLSNPRLVVSVSYACS